MTHHTSKGSPISKPLTIIIDAAIKAGIEAKPLAIGIRLKGVDVVVSDAWRGLYLCKSGGRGLSRTSDESNGLQLKPADKGQWCVSTEVLAIDDVRANEQALALVTMACEAGYIGLCDVRDTMQATVATLDIPHIDDSEQTSEQVSVSDTRRKKGNSKASALDKALAILD